MTQICISIFYLLAKNPPANAGDPRHEGLIPGWGGSPGVGNGNLIQYFCLENSMGKRSLMGYSSWGHEESDTIEHTHKKIDTYRNLSIY